MISYIASKSILFNDIKNILSVSKKLNHFSNNGPVKQALERKLENLFEIDSSKRVVCLNNGTAALHAIMMLCISKGYNKFVTPAFTFPSVTVGGFSNMKILDIDPNTYTLKLDDSLLKYNVIILTNLFGTFPEINDWISFCKQNNIILIFDNASSPLSKYKEKNICNFGDFSFGSLHHTKFLGFGEGGFAVVPESDYYEIIKISNFGFYDTKIYQKLSSNFKMSDVSAAFILQHINNYNINLHVEIQNIIIKELNKININIFNYKPGVIYGNLPILFDKITSRDIFRSLNIEANKYYKPLKNYKNSINIYNRIINFPLYASLKLQEIKKIIEAIKFYIETM